MNVRLFAALLIALFSLSVMTGCAPGNLEAQPTKQERLSQPEVGALTAQEAEAIATAHAQIEPTEVSRLYTELDFDDGILKYEIEFVSGNIEYEYKIHAETGEVLQSKAEPKGKQAPSEPAPSATPAPTPAPAVEQLTKEQAQQIALKHAGLSQSQVTRLRTEFDYDDGVPEYSVEFRYNGWEYDYEIHARSGKILEWDKEFDD